MNNKVALVSGAGRGIGREIAVELAKLGCKVVCVSKNLSSCSKVAEDINAMGLSAEAFAVDVANAQDVKNLCTALINKYEAVDIIVNNAGITRDNLLMRMSDEEWRDVMSTNLDACFYIVRNLVRPMMSKRWGRIINITSISGQMGNAGQLNYSSAKAGMIGFTKTLARELASRNITANAIAPGFIKTDMTASLPRPVVNTILENIPLKRMGEPSDIAKACAFLASQDASYITGQVLAINGGLGM